jgi:hypothetical protein
VLSSCESALRLASVHVNKWPSNSRLSAPLFRHRRRRSVFALSSVSSSSLSSFFWHILAYASLTATPVREAGEALWPDSSGSTPARGTGSTSSACLPREHPSQTQSCERRLHAEASGLRGMQAIRRCIKTFRKPMSYKKIHLLEFPFKLRQSTNII